MKISFFNIPDEKERVKNLEMRNDVQCNDWYKWNFLALKSMIHDWSFKRLVAVNSILGDVWWEILERLDDSYKYSQRRYKCCI